MVVHLGGEQRLHLVFRCDSLDRGEHKIQPAHPKNFTPIRTTELGTMAGLKPEFDKRNTKIIALSVDPVENHAKWARDIEETQGHAVNYPAIGRETATRGLPRC